MDDILGGILSAGERIFGKTLDYKVQRDQLNALTEADERRYDLQARRSRYLSDGSLNPLYGTDAGLGGALPLILAGGAVLLVAVVLIAKA